MGRQDRGVSMSGEIEYIINCRNIGTTKCHRGALKGSLQAILLLKVKIFFFVYDNWFRILYAY